MNPFHWKLVLIMKIDNIYIYKKALIVQTTTVRTMIIGMFLEWKSKLWQYWFIWKWDGKQKINKEKISV